MWLYVPGGLPNFDHAHHHIILISSAGMRTTRKYRVNAGYPCSRNAKRKAADFSFTNADALPAKIPQSRPAGYCVFRQFDRRVL